mgnify:CR=1 FL=1
MSITIRSAKPDDCSKIYRFICDLAEYEKALEEVKCTAESLQKSLFEGAPCAHALMLEERGQAIGYAIYFFNYSTWLAAKGLYLEDIYVDPAYRGKGAGKMLMNWLANTAVSQGCKRFEWSVLDWNTPSIEFYESLGARSQDEWLGYRLEGEALQRLASLNGKGYSAQGG